ncbi:MAG TPA: ribosome maturation factor RimP [Acidimicrobiia bacterium]|nr:ribosome maturation factor RimP [Acidimicrobiia bacterium]
MADQSAVWVAAEPVLSSLGLELVDVEFEGSGRARTLRLSIDREGGVDLDTLAEANGPVSDALDAVDAVSGPYNLELSSPGVERPLRRPSDFRRFIGTPVSVKSHEPIAGARRHRGLLVVADDEGIGLEVDGQARRFPYDAIASARTVFEWGPAPKPIGPAKRATTDRPVKERSQR